MKFPLAYELYLVNVNLHEYISRSKVKEKNGPNNFTCKVKINMTRGSEQVKKRLINQPAELITDVWIIHEKKKKVPYIHFFLQPWTRTQKARG